MTRTVVMVCTANIARSPSAEHLTRQILAELEQAGTSRSAWQVASAGVQAVVGAGIDPVMAAEVQRRGVDPTPHRARQLDHQIMAEADLVLTFDRRHRSWALSQWPDAARRVFTIRAAAAILGGGPRRADPLDVLASTDRPQTAADDFADPYGRGPAAARIAVDEIETLLRTVVPALVR